MSEEKLYAVKNAKGIYLFVSDDKHYRWREGWREGEIAATTSQRIAHDLCTEHGGHVVTFIEEPKKVVLTKEQAEIVEKARVNDIPATYISARTNEHNGEESLLMNAYVNGYTVAKEKKYRVLAPRSWWYAIDAPLYLLFSFTEGMRFTVKKDDPSTVFTKEQLSAFGLDGEYFQKEEVTDDEQ